MKATPRANDWEVWRNIQGCSWLVFATCFPTSFHKSSNQRVPPSTTPGHFSLCKCQTWCSSKSIHHLVADLLAPFLSLLPPPHFDWGSFVLARGSLYPRRTFPTTHSSSSQPLNNFSAACPPSTPFPLRIFPKASPRELGILRC